MEGFLPLQILLLKKKQTTKLYFELILDLQKS